MKTYCYPRPFFVIFTILFFQQNIVFSQAYALTNAIRQDKAVSSQSRSLKVVLQELESKFDVYFNFDEADVGQQIVQAPLKNSFTLEESLRSLLEPLQLKYEKVGEKYYTIFPKRSKKIERARQKQATKELSDASQKENSLTAESSTSSVTSEKVALQISGKVTDEKSAGIPGVNVLLKGTTNGTTSDLDGNYILTVPDGSGTLMFSYIGYVTEEVPINNRTTINVSLVPDIKSLSEVVVVGYGTQKKRDVTGAISSISQEQVNALPVSRFDQALQGRVSGVQVTANSGQPGGSVSVRIRGIGTINSNEPLYVIDGIPLFGDQALNSLNTNDIESMEVLKDASATAIYGARAANGVVIITTKRGKEGKPSLSYDGYGGVQQLSRRYDMLNAREYALLSNEMRSANHGEPLTPEWFDPENIPGAIDTDWQEEIFRIAPIQNHTLTMSGGTQNARYLISGNYFDQQGIVKGSDFSRYTIRANVDGDIKSWLKIGTNLLFSRTGESTEGNAIRINNALNQLPLIPVKNPDGSWGGSTSKAYYGDISNPVAEIELFDNNLNRNRFLGSIFAELELLPGLILRPTYSIDNSLLHIKNFTPTYTFGIVRGTAANINQTNNRNVQQTFETSLSFNRTFFQKHVISVVGVFSAQESAFSSESASATGLVSDFVPYLDAKSGDVNVSGGANEWSILSYTGRINYAFADKYLLSATVRRDGSSRFGRNYRYATFPAFSLGWRISGENFMQGINFIDELKLRASWGQSGNQEIGLYGFASNLSNSQRYVFGQAQTIVPGVVPVSLANPDLRWETATQTNIGLDVSLMENRLQLSGNYYIKKTEDMLVRVPLPSISGITVFPFKNAGNMENKGIELDVSYRKTTGNLNYTIGGNFTTINNKVISLGAGQDIFSGTFTDASASNQGGRNVTITRPGDAVGSYYGWVTDGLFQNLQEIDAHARQNGAAPGDIRFKDLNEDGVIDGKDRTIIGSPIPDFIYGFNANASFKGFDLGLFFQGVYGNEIYNGTRTFIAGVNTVNNYSTEVLGRWRGEGTSNSVPRAVAFDTPGNTRVSDRWIEDGSYLRLKNLTLGYTIPQKVLDFAKVQNVRLYVSGTNLLTFTKYTGLDPEVGDRGQNALFSGIDQSVYPVASTYTIGLNIGF